MRQLIRSFKYSPLLNDLLTFSVTFDQVNTERVPTENNGMTHAVGGWPKEYDYQETNEINKYMRKLVKEPQLCFGQATRELV